MRTRRGSLLPALLLAVLAAGCTWTQSHFARTANQAGGTFAAAAVTLNDLHAGKLTSDYARAAFVNYQSQLRGLDQAMPSQTGAPDPASLRSLLQLYMAAMPAVNAPCLTARCDWRTQVHALDAASQAFLQAGGG